MYQRNNDVSDGCLATGEGTSETNFNKFSFDSKLKASDQHYGGHGLNSSLKLWKSFPWILHCQPTITNVDIDKANKAALVGAEDNLLTTHVVTKLHLLYKHCPSFSGTKCRMYWNWEDTVQIQSLHCVWRFPVSCFDLICFNLFFVTLKFSHFNCRPRVSS